MAVSQIRGQGRCVRRSHFQLCLQRRIALRLLATGPHTCLIRESSHRPMLLLLLPYIQVTAAWHGTVQDAGSSSATAPAAAAASNGAAQYKPVSPTVSTARLSAPFAVSPKITSAPSVRKAGKSHDADLGVRRCHSHCLQLAEASQIFMMAYVYAFAPLPAPPHLGLKCPSAPSGLADPPVRQRQVRRSTSVERGKAGRGLSLSC